MVTKILVKDFRFFEVSESQDSYCRLQQYEVYTYKRIFHSPGGKYMGSIHAPVPSSYFLLAQD